MYEDMTYENLLEEKLEQVPDTFDTREGSLLHMSLAANSAELAQAYVNLRLSEDRFWIDTATGEDLDLKCRERGIARHEATQAVRYGIFTFNSQNSNLPVGTRFRGGDNIFISGDAIKEGYKLHCETPGSTGNYYIGNLIPVEDVESLETALISDILIPGADTESDEDLRERYYENINSQSYGGNVSDYKKWAKGISGVGGVKVYPVWAGGGTVKLEIIDNTFSVPSAMLIEAVQNEIDPAEYTGSGIGKAPIGHKVTVTGVESEEITVSLSLETAEGNSSTSEIESIIKKYFKQLSEQWETQDNLIVRVSQIETRILNMPGIMDVHETKLNGVNQNVLLEGKIPVLKAVELL